MSSQKQPPASSEHSLEHALASAALKRLSAMQPADFVKSLKAQGINSLEDLANKSLETARAASAAGAIAFDPEVFGVCYKFSSYRPHFEQATIDEVVNIVNRAAR